MIIVVIKKLKNRMMQLLRMLFVLAILIILMAQLVEAVKSIDIKNDLPKGDSVRVNSNFTVKSEQTEKDQGIESWLDSLLNILKSYHRGE